jgi:hypothetical protein
MLQEQQQPCAISEMRDFVSHHLVLYDIGTFLPRNRPHSPAATASSFPKAMPGDVQLLCDRNELNSSFCLIWECQHWSYLQAFDEMHGYLTCRVRVSVRFSPLTTTATGPADCSQPCGQLRRPDHTTMAPGMQICCNHLTCLCLPCMAIRTCEIRHRDATPAIRAQRQVWPLPHRRKYSCARDCRTHIW